MLVELRVIPNKLRPDEFEKNLIAAGQTLHQWLLEAVPSYDSSRSAVFSVEINGKKIEGDSWRGIVLLAADVVEIFVEPREPATIVMAVIAVVSAAVAIHYANQAIPDNYNTTSPSGSSVYSANAQGNRPRLMGIVPFGLGTHVYYPDYLNAPRREYVDSVEYLYLMLSLGVGEYDFLHDTFKIGDTLVSHYGEDIEYEIFSPGELITHEANRNTYVSADVGGSNGSGGFELLGSDYSFRGREDGIIGCYNSANDPVSNVVGERRTGEFFTSFWSFDGLNVGDYVEIHNDEGDNRPYFDGYFQVVEDLSDAGTRLARVDPYTLAVIATEDIFNIPDGVAVPVAKSRVRRIILGAGGDYVGPYAATPASKKASSAFLDFKMPQGLCVLDDQGVPQSRTLDIVISWRDQDGEWVRESRQFTDATVDARAYTVTLDFGAEITPEIQCHRLTHDENDLKYKDQIQWTGLRSDLAVIDRYADMTTLAMKIRGSNALASSAENKINVLCQRRLQTFDDSGALTVFEGSNDIAPALYAVCRSAGYTDAQIDLEELYRLHQTWQARGDEFNAIFDNESTAWDAIKRVLAVGFAEPTLDFGQIIPVRDEPRENIQFGYQADNILKNSWKMDITLFDESEPDGVEVEYFSNESRKPETILCTLPGEAGAKPLKVRPFGITDRDKAYQYGMRKRSEQRYRRKRHTWMTEMDGLNSRYLSFDALAIDMPGYSQTGRVDAVAGSVVDVNQALEFGLGVHYISLRKPDGTLAGPYECQRGANDAQVVVEGVIDSAIEVNAQQEPPYFMFGEADAWCEKVLIKEINPRGTEKVQLKAVSYDERVFAYDDALAPV